MRPLRQNPGNYKTLRQKSSNARITIRIVLSAQIEDFRRNVLRDTSNGAFERMGVRGYEVFPRLQGYDAVALTFDKNITQEQREQILMRVKASSLVYKIFENIRPADVKLK